MRLFGHSDADLYEMHNLGVAHGRRMAALEEFAKSTDRLMDLIKQWDDGLATEEVLKQLAAWEAE